MHGKKYNYTWPRRNVTPEALRLVIDANRGAVERYGMDRLMDGIAIIKQTCDGHFAEEISRKLST